MVFSDESYVRGEVCTCILYQIMLIYRHFMLVYCVGVVEQVTIRALVPKIPRGNFTVTLTSKCL